MKKFIHIVSVAFLSMLILAADTSVFAAQKLFVKQFTMVNLPSDDPAGRKVSKQIENAFFDHGGYDPLTQEDVVAGAALDEAKQELGCDDDRCLKALLTASKIDLIVYGTVKNSNGYIYITAKMLDKSRGAVELARIKTIKLKDEFKDTEYYKQGCDLLANYLLTGNTEDIQDFQDRMYVEEKRSETELRNVALEVESLDEATQFEKNVEKFKKQRREEIAGKYSMFRFGYSNWGMQSKSSEFNEYYDRGQLFMGDWIIAFDRDNLSGFDMYFRYTYKSFNLRDDITVTVADPLYPFLAKGEDYTVHLFDLGLRYRIGLYLMMTKIDLYALGAARFDFAGTYGMYGGGGVEIAFFQTVGFFGEYNYGTFKAKEQTVSGYNTQTVKVDLENHQIIFGATLRM